MFPPDNNVISLYEEQYFNAWPMDFTRTAADVVASDFSVLPFSFDSQFSQRDYSVWALYFRQTWLVPLIVAVVYCTDVFVGQFIMRSRKAYDLKGFLALWNLLLAVFSIIGTIKVVPYFLYTLVVNGPTYFVCRYAGASYGQGGEVSFWCLAFVLSKYAELIDTAFLVLRKKAVPFLHWYHHATVMLISVYTMAVGGPSGIVMVAMNFFVHSVMYTYYFLAAVMDKPPRWGRIVTTLQIAQMVIGSLMAVAIYVATVMVEGCYSVPSNNATIAAIYLSYLVLFMRFYTQRYNKAAALAVQKSD